jgi:hypothetical protein
MKHKWLIVATAAFLLLLNPILFRKHTVPLLSNGKVVAIAKRSFAPHWKDSVVDVYVGKEKVFSLWSDFFDFPLFIYPFPDKQRFLCIDDDAAPDGVKINSLENCSTNMPHLTALRFAK